MKEYKISPAQLIELIKNNRLNPSGNKINLSLINSTSVDQLIERKEIDIIDWFTKHFFFALNKIYSLKIQFKIISEE